jgi:hypothetical protein
MIFVCTELIAALPDDFLYILCVSAHRGSRRDHVALLTQLYRSMLLYELISSSSLEYGDYRHLTPDATVAAYSGIADS